MSSVSPHSVVEVLHALERVGLECIGARVLPGDELELRIASRSGSVDPGSAIERAWPGRSAHLLLERLPDATRARMHVARGLWIAWQSRLGVLHSHRPDPVEDDRIHAFEVRKGEGSGDEEVVMASTPDEAAAYYARGWGLPQGSLVTVAWEERRPRSRHPAIPLRQTRMYRVLNQGRVATLQG